MTAVAMSAWPHKFYATQAHVTIRHCIMHDEHCIETQDCVKQTNLYSEAGMTVVLNIIRRQQLPGLQQTPAALFCLRGEFAVPNCCKHSHLSVVRCSKFAKPVSDLSIVEKASQSVYCAKPTYLDVTLQLIAIVGCEVEFWSRSLLLLFAIFLQHRIVKHLRAFYRMNLITN